MGYVTLKNTCSEGADANTIDVEYLIIDTVSPYNIILGCLTINALWEVISKWYLTLKYLLLDGRLGTIKENEQVNRECYLISTKTARE